MSIAATESSATRRPIPLRMRGDLLVSRSVFQGEISWIVKDPIALKYFRLRNAEHEILKLLDGENSYEEIRRRLVAQFPTRKFEVRDLQRLVQSFHAGGLLLSNASGQAESLQRRRDRQRNQKVAQRLSSIIAIRFPGFDPEPLLSWLYPKVSWLFSRVAAVGCALIVMAALLLVATQLDQVLARLPTFQQFFGFDNLVHMLLVLVLTKSLHELGHGLMCKHFKGECHEMGFMLMVLTPAMYCDTSDSWILPSKWHRIAIGAAGMWFEVVVASIATFVWWFTHPGWLHYFALNIMFLCSVATIVFNINPLLRYDGYFMLSDYLEIPNLSQRASRALTSFLRVWCLGMAPLPQSGMPTRHQWAFSAYSVASLFYRWFVMVMIFWFLTQVFEPWGLQAIAYLAIGMSLLGSVGLPLYRCVKFFSFPGRMREIKLGRLNIMLLVLVLLLALFLFVPVPQHVEAEFVLRPRNAQSLFVQSPGCLQHIYAKYGDAVEAGQPVARLEDLELEVRIREMQSELQRQETLAESWRLDDHDPLEAARLAGEARAKIAQLRRQLAEREKQQKQLVLVSDRGGYLIAPANIPRRLPRPGQLETWSGTPLEDRNLSATLTTDTLVGYVGPLDEFTAMLCVPQDQCRFLRPNQEVLLTFNAARGERIHGVVDSVSNRALDALPRELSSSNGGPLPASPESRGVEKPMLTMFEAAVAIQDGATNGPANEGLQLLPGMRGRAKVSVGRAPLASQLYRHLLTVFRFQ